MAVIRQFMIWLDDVSHTCTCSNTNSISAHISCGVRCWLLENVCSVGCRPPQRSTSSSAWQGAAPPRGVLSRGFQESSTQSRMFLCIFSLLRLFKDASVCTTMRKRFDPPGWVQPRCSTMCGCACCAKRSSTNIGRSKKRPGRLYKVKYTSCHPWLPSIFS